MTLRAKFTVLSITQYQYSTSVKLQAQYSNSPEDNQFSEATPSGTLEMSVTTPAGKEFFKVGSKYYMDFTEVES